MATMTLANDGAMTRIDVARTASLRLALECGYEWVNLHDGEGWQQIAVVARKQEIRRAVGL